MEAIARCYLLVAVTFSYVMGATRSTVSLFTVT